jgi:two-component system, NtrC family, nitrogen regulation response regulator NtrX
MTNILIVEDEKVLNEAYALVLKKAGYSVATAFNGEEALEESAKKDFDLILLDLRMPKMNGVEFLKKFNPKKNHPQTKIIIFSNYDDEKEVNEAIENGATRYILKAWSSPSELIKLVRESLADDS